MKVTLEDLKIDNCFTVNSNQSIIRKKEEYNFEVVSASNVLFYDIETAPSKRHFSELSPEKQKLWEVKYNKIINGGRESFKNVTAMGDLDSDGLKRFDELYLLAELAEDNINYPNKDIFRQINMEQCYFEKAGLYPEFGRIVCISVGKRKTSLNLKTNEYVYKDFILTFQNEDEKVMLQDFSKFIAMAVVIKNDKIGKLNQSKYIFGANLRGFDNAWMWRKCLSYGIMPPKIFHQMGREKWNDLTIDIIQDIWKMGGFVNVGDCTFDAICNMLGVESPKNGNVHGSDVGKSYYNGEIDWIIEYCELDVKKLIECWDVLSKLESYEYNV
jgi:hypothetical protein